jgi:hypothetical protein
VSASQGTAALIAQIRLAADGLSTSTGTADIVSYNFLGTAAGVSTSTGSATLTVPVDLYASGVSVSIGTADLTTVPVAVRRAFYLREFAVYGLPRTFNVSPPASPYSTSLPRVFKVTVPGRIFEVSAPSRLMEVHNVLCF